MTRGTGTALAQGASEPKAIYINYLKNQKTIPYVVGNLYQRPRWPQYRGTKLRRSNTDCLTPPLHLRPCEPAGAGTPLSHPPRSPSLRRALPYPAVAAASRLGGTFKKTIQKFTRRQLLPLKPCTWERRDGESKQGSVGAGSKPVLLQMTAPHPQHPQRTAQSEGFADFWHKVFPTFFPQDLVPISPRHNKLNLHRELRNPFC